jgi:hypothetical protein
MVHQSTPFFPHRRLPDGKLQSICLSCLATVGIRDSHKELAELDKAHVCNSIYSSKCSVIGTMIIPAKTPIRANISKLREDDTIYAIHLVVQKEELFLRKIFASWLEAERAIANLHLSEPFATHAASKFAMGYIQYGESVENLRPIEPELLGFQIGA